MDAKDAVGLLPSLQKVPLSRQGKKRVIVLSGPTASGKTQLSLKLAQAIGGEIISADSMQIYRGLDIGTAKPSVEERLLVTHHLMDICDLNEGFNVAEFYKETQSVLREVFLRDNVPIVVGGSGFYIHTLLYGPPLGPPSVPEVRGQLEQQMKDLGVEVLYERLQMLDPIHAATISEHDRHKIIRSLEIIALTDRPVSDFSRTSELQDYDFRCWFIYYPREKLYTRIEMRCEEMLRQGFLNEVKEAKAKGLCQNPSTAQAIGYRQALEYLDSAQPQADYDRFVAKFKTASRQYAKRQFTWFRKEPLFRWINLEEHPKERIKEQILQDFEQGI